jgi:hypothetical protein
MRSTVPAVAVERIFLLIGGVLGVILLVVSSPFGWGDEDTHLLHAYRLAALRLDLTSNGSRMTVELPRGVSRLEMLSGWTACSSAAAGRR